MNNESQLDISTPILSARRHLDPRLWSASKISPRGTQLSPHLDRLEWESEVSKPAAIPFQWERTPGRPKRDYLYHSDKEPAITPRTPPRRLFEVYSPRPHCGMIHKAQHLSGEPLLPSRLIVPGRKFGEMFSPRLRPGRLVGLKHAAGEVRTPKLTSRRLSDVLNISGRKSWVQNNIKRQGEAFTTNDHESLLECLKDSLDADGESDEDKEHDAFSDTFCSFSPGESLSLKSGVSDLSSSYYRNCGSSGNFSVDLQARAFMMSRFLPAAEAAVAHVPRQVPKNPTMVIGKTVNKVIPSQRKSLLKQPGLNVRPSPNQLMEYLEIDDEDVECNDPKIRTSKTCGIFHRLCGQNVVFCSNKKSSMKLKTKPSQPSSSEVNKLTRNTYSGPVINPLVKRYKPTQSSNMCASKEGRPSNSRTKKWKTMAGSEAIYDFGSTGMVTTSTGNSKLPGIAPIMDEFNQERNCFKTEELKDSKNMMNGEEESNHALLLHPLPIPSPKPPSESWVCLSLPSISLQNPFSHSHGGRH